MYKYWWIPIVFVIYSLIGIFSKKSSDSQEFGSSFYLLLFFGILSPIVWAIVSTLSKNIIVDSLLFQVFALLGLFSFMTYLGASKGFTAIHWVGFGLAILGIALISLFPLAPQ